MSEYQYYEFRAIDRPLTQKQMDEVGEYSTRAEITPTSFTNEYHWGNFRGDVLKFIEKYFDAMVYTANWGTHRFVFRVPADLIDLAAVKPYCAGESAEISVKGGNLIFDLTSQIDDSEDEPDPGDWMSGLISVRAELLAGDLRPLYIAWLASAEHGELDDSDMEPAVPPGLKKLTAGQKDLAAFLRVDDELLSVAATASAELAATRGDDDFNGWLTSQPGREKDELLIALVTNADPFLPTRLRRQFQKQHASPVKSSTPERTVSQLLEEAERLRAKRKAAADEAAARERARKAAEAEQQRAAHLDRLAQRGEAPWNEVEKLVESKQPAKYDSAVTLLKDLRDLALQRGMSAQFALRVHSLVDRHAKKGSFRQRIMKASVIPQSPGVA